MNESEGKTRGAVAPPSPLVPASLGNGDYSRGRRPGFSSQKLPVSPGAMTCVSKHSGCPGSDTETISWGWIWSQRLRAGVAARGVAAGDVPGDCSQTSGGCTALS